LNGAPARKGFRVCPQTQCNKLVHVEFFDDPESAITREKRLKKWNRDWKLALIEQEIRIGRI